MAIHKYITGQSVKFLPQRSEAGSPGIYTIVRLLPEVGSAPQYRIKAKVDGQERVVEEHRLIQA